MVPQGHLSCLDDQLTQALVAAQTNGSAVSLGLPNYVKQLVARLRYDLPANEKHLPYQF